MHEILHDPIDQSPVTAVCPPATIGSILTGARTEQGLERRDVANRTGLSIPVVRGLEDDDFDSLGAPVFVRGYLIRYVRFLGLPEQELLERYKQLTSSDLPPLRVTRTIKPQTRMSDIRWFSYPLLLALAGWLSWVGWDRFTAGFGPSDGATDKTPAVLAQSNTALPLPRPAEDKIEAKPMAKSSAPPRPSSAPIATATAQENSAPLPVTNEATPAVEPTPAVEATPPVALVDSAEQAETSVQTPPADEPETPPVSDSEPQLVLEFTDECWVDVRDANGERLAYGLMKPDTVRTLTGTVPFSITLGNAGAVQIALNGRLIERSVYIPERGTVSRFTLDEATP